MHHYSTMKSTIVVPYIDGLYRYAMSITRNPTDAEDLVQETDVRAIRGQRLKDGLRHVALKGLRPEKKPGLIRRSPQLERGPF